MPQQASDQSTSTLSGAPEDAFELGSFAQNVSAFEGIVARMEAEVFGPDPNIDRLGIYQSEVHSILSELRSQQARTILAHGEDDANVQRLQHILTVRLTKVAAKVEELISVKQDNLDDLYKQMEILESIPLPGSPIDNHNAAGEDATMTDLTRQEVDAKLAANKAEVDARLTAFDASIKTGFADLRSEFAEFRAEMAKQTSEMRTEMANTRTEVHKGSIDIIKWVVGFGIAILGTVFTLSKIAEKPPSQTSAQPAPIVITVPGAVVSQPITPERK